MIAATIQRLPDGPGELDVRIWFLQKPGVIIPRQKVRADVVHCVAAGKDDAQLAAQRNQLVREFHPGNPRWHHHIGKEQVNAALVLFPDFQSFLAVTCEQDFVTAFLQDHLRHFA